jgi:proteasome lid subunit RPN8/RPN11
VGEEPAPRLRLPVTLRARLEAWAREGHPFEACGLLIGRADDDGAEVREVMRAENLATDRPRDRYRVDPADQLRAELRARELGLEVVGVWHSHPDRGATPSETDRAAAVPCYSYVILAVGARGVQDLRSFRLAGERFTEERLRP